MKKLIRPILDVSALLAIPICLFILLFGCATGANRTPTAFEQKFFDIKTNYAPQVMITSITNFLIEKVRQVVVETNTVTVTNQAGIQEAKIVYIPLTNTILKEVPVVTKVYVTNTEPTYSYTPNATADMIKTGAGTAGSLFGPYGGIAAAAVGGIFGLWGHLRSSKANATSEVLTQVIETGSELMKTSPQGAALADKWKTWMITHQAEQGVIENVTKIVANVVDNTEARNVAGKLADLTTSVKGA